MNNIAELNNLVFFTEKGYEIPLLKDYTIVWEIIPDNLILHNFLNNPKGHFVLNKNDKSSISCIVDDPGLILKYKIFFTDLNQEEHSFSDLTANSVPSGYTDTSGETIYNNYSILFFRYYYRLKRNKYDEYSDINLSNKVKLTITTYSKTIVEYYDIDVIFNPKTIPLSNFDLISIYTGSYNSTETIYRIKDNILELTKFNGKPMILLILTKIIGDNSSLYPYVQYQGLVYLDKVSENFISTNTIIIYEKDKNGSLITPSIVLNDEGDRTYALQFEFLKDSEMKFISSSTEANIIWEDTFNTDSIYRTSEILTLKRNAPIHFSVGFLSDTEGTYQNAMGIFLVETNSETITRKYFIGFINFITEVEGEDERFRALLGNFGIPDPIKYPNIFKEQDPMEQLVDWTVVNKKSKELMIYYDNIFPYVGTYKALMNALKFLGYLDIVFKEWYKIKDLNDRDRYALIQLYDFTTGEPFKSKLKRANVTFGEFERYRKLNRLTMIYHLNEIDYKSGERLDLWVNKKSSYVVDKVYKAWFCYNSYEAVSTYKSSEVLDTTIEYLAELEAADKIYVGKKSSYYNLKVGKKETENEIWSALDSGNFILTDSDGKFYTYKPNGTDYTSKYTTKSKLKSSKQWRTENTNDILFAYKKDKSTKQYYANVHNEEWFHNRVNAKAEGFIWSGYGYVGGTESFDTSTAAYEDFLNNGNITTDPLLGLYKASQLNPEWIKMEDQLIDIPTTYKLYEYRSDEVLAKLYSVKLWLEKYILGVNCYISDICGEGIIIERLKNQAYVTEHLLHDYYTEGHFTPKITNITNFLDSSATITCTLNEYNNVTIEDYKDYSISNFVKKVVNLPNVGDLDSSLFVSNTIETLVVGNELQYELHLDNASFGSLVEFTKDEYSDNPIYLNEGELLLWNDEQNETVFDSSKSPIIIISKGNIRKTHGEWKDAVKYSIVPVLDTSTLNYNYILTDIDTGITYTSTLKYIIKSEIANNENIGILKYSCNNKWNIPMFIMKSFYFYNAENIEIDANCEYILEIIEGSIKFKNEYKDNMPIGAELVFSETDYEGFEYQGEQYIGINYTYISEKLPIYSFTNIDNIRVTPGSGEYTEDFSRYNAEILDSSNITFSDASEDSLRFINSSISHEFTEYSNKFRTLDGYRKTYNNFINTLYSGYSNNIFVDVPVNRIGTYSITVKAYDNYNDIFVNKSDDTWKVQTKPISIETVVNQSNSNNNFDFYNYNKNGELLENPANIINRASLTPQFPIKYRIYDFEYNDDIDNITYDNISYALDTPKANDYLILNNLTERAYKIAGNDSNLTLYMSDENPKRLNLYRPNGRVGICLYDSIKKRILETYCPIEVTNISEQNYDISTALSYKSTIKGRNVGENKISGSLLETLIGNDLTNSYYLIFVFNAIELILDDSKISFDYENNLTFIKDGNYKSFNIGDMISICYSYDNDTHELYDELNVDNEVAYKIVDIKFEDNTYYYILNGILDLHKLDNNLYHNVNKVNLSKKFDTIYKVNNNKIIIKLCPLHLDAVLYTLRVNKDAIETSKVYSRYNYYIMNTTFEYVPNQLLFKSYMDDTYSGFVYDYDNINLYKIWYKANKIYNNDDLLYIYENYPITISKGQNIIIYPDDTLNILINSYEDKDTPYKIEWVTKIYMIDELNNWRNATNVIGKETLFRSTNRVLSISPELLGPYLIQLRSIDIFGNLVVNDGEGLIYVNDNEEILKKLSSNDDGEDEPIEEVTIIAINILDAYASRNINRNGETIRYNDVVYVKYQIIYSNSKIKVGSTENPIEGVSLNIKDTNNNSSKTISNNQTSDIKEYNIDLNINIRYEGIDATELKSITLLQDGNISLSSISISGEANMVSNTGGSVNANNIALSVYAIYSDGSQENIRNSASISYDPTTITGIGYNYYENIILIEPAIKVTATYNGLVSYTYVNVYLLKSIINSVVLTVSPLSFEIESDQNSYANIINSLNISTIVRYSDNVDNSNTRVNIKFSKDNKNWVDTISDIIQENKDLSPKEYHLYVKATSNINPSKYDIKHITITLKAHVATYTYRIEWNSIVPTTKVFTFSSLANSQSYAKSTTFYIVGTLYTLYDNKVMKSLQVYYGLNISSIGELVGTLNININAKQGQNTDFNTSYTNFTKKNNIYLSTLKIWPTSVNTNYNNTYSFGNLSVANLECSSLGPYNGNPNENINSSAFTLYFDILANQYAGGINRESTISFSINAKVDGNISWEAKSFSTTISVTLTSIYNEGEPLLKNYHMTSRQEITKMGYDNIDFEYEGSNKYVNSKSNVTYDTTVNKWKLSGYWVNTNIANKNCPIKKYTGLKLIKNSENSKTTVSYKKDEQFILYADVQGKPVYGPIPGLEYNYYVYQPLYIYAASLDNDLIPVKRSNSITLFLQCEDFESNMFVNMVNDSSVINGLNTNISNTLAFSVLDNEYGYNNTLGSYYTKIKTNNKNITEEPIVDSSVRLSLIYDNMQLSISYSIMQNKNTLTPYIIVTNEDGNEITTDIDITEDTSFVFKVFKLMKDLDLEEVSREELQIDELENNYTFEVVDNFNNPLNSNTEIEFGDTLNIKVNIKLNGVNYGTLDLEEN